MFLNNLKNNLQLLQLLQHLSILIRPFQKQVMKLQLVSLLLGPLSLVVSVLQARNVVKKTK